MEKLEVFFGVMGAAKTSNLLLQVRNFKIALNREVLIFKPEKDTRNLKIIGKENGWKVAELSSRVDIESEKCYLIEDDRNLFEGIKELTKGRDISCIFIDEHQFLTPKQVKELSDVVDYLNIDVKTYGLSSQYIDGKIFEGVEALIFYADKINEIETTCKYCKRKATHNLRISNNKPVYTGEEIIIQDIDDNDVDRYEAVCRIHYKHPPVRQ